MCVRVLRLLGIGFLLLGLLVAGCGSGAAVDNELTTTSSHSETSDTSSASIPATTAPAATSLEPSCIDLFMFWWAPLAAVDEFNDLLPEYSPSQATWDRIWNAAAATVEGDSTEETWHRARMEAWLSLDPSTFQAACSMFSAGERLVVAELSSWEAAECFNWAADYFGGMLDSEMADAAGELGIEIPTTTEIDPGQAARVWAANHSQDFLAVCRVMLG
jgi:hypothetical protein